MAFPWLVDDAAIFPLQGHAINDAAGHAFMTSEVMAMIFASGLR
jgi:hypothetical protein